MTTKLALPLVLLMACVTPDEIGAIDQEIVGGQRVSTTEFPTVVALQHGAGNWFCTGVLVDKDWVLTTASCFTDTSATQARIGDADLGDGTISGATISIAAIHKHPQFSTTDPVWRHDVAVLRLAQSVTDRVPSPIRRDVTVLGAAITQAGFGVNTNSGAGGGVLRSLGTTNVDCARASDSGITNENLLCFDAADGTGSCYGDGGAPAFVTGTSGTRIVVGVASGGTGSSCTSGLDIYTALVPELSFIDTYVPVPPTPPPTNPPTPPPSNPDGGGAGSGSGDGRDPDGSGADGDGKRETLHAGCSVRGGSGWLAVLGIVLVIGLRRRRARRS